MAREPEEEARATIDQMLDLAGWNVQDCKDANIHARFGVALRYFPLKSGHGFADYILYVNEKAAGVIEAKKVGSTLSGVEIQSGKYKHGLPTSLPAWHRPLPFCYESTGVETHFTNGLDPSPRSRNVFSFHRPETLFRWITDNAAPSNIGAVSVEQLVTIYGHFEAPGWIFASPMVLRVKRLPMIWS